MRRPTCRQFEHFAKVSRGKVDERHVAIDVALDVIADSGPVETSSAFVPRLSSTPIFCRSQLRDSAAPLARFYLRERGSCFPPGETDVTPSPANDYAPQSA